MIKVEYLVPVLIDHFVEQQVFHHGALRSAKPLELVFHSHATNSFVFVSSPIKGDVRLGNVVGVTGRVTGHPEEEASPAECDEVGKKRAYPSNSTFKSTLPS